MSLRASDKIANQSCHSPGCVLLRSAFYLSKIKRCGNHASEQANGKAQAMCRQSEQVLLNKACFPIKFFF